jgi:hypothetical protein
MTAVENTFCPPGPHHHLTTTSRVFLLSNSTRYTRENFTSQILFKENSLGKPKDNKEIKTKTWDSLAFAATANSRHSLTANQ